MTCHLFTARYFDAGRWGYRVLCAVHDPCKSDRVMMEAVESPSEEAKG